MLLTTSVLFALVNLARSEECHGRSSPPRLVLFSFDGFRPDYVTASRMPVLYGLAREGVRARMRATFVTKTFPNHHSIVTGLYQRWHGIMHNQFIDPLRPEEIFTVRTAASPFWWDMYNFSVPIYIANQLHSSGRFSGSIQWPGSLSNYTDGVVPEHRHRVHYVTPFDKDPNWYTQMDRVIKWMRSPSHPANLVVIYIDEPDSTSHQYGPFSHQVAAQLDRIDTVIGYFLKRLRRTGLYDQVNLMLISDHGMSEITEKRVIFLDECNNHFPGLRYRLLGRSPVFSVLPLSAPIERSFRSMTIVEAVRGALDYCSRAFYKNRIKVYRKSEIPVEFHYGENRRVLPILLLADDGYEIALRHHWHPKPSPRWGQHGYNNSLPSMQPLFIAHGPAFRRNYDHPSQFDNVDLYPLMLSVLRLPPHRFTHHNGTLDNVQAMLNDSRINIDRKCDT